MALLEIARPLSQTLAYMSTGCCCMCGLPVRDHTKHLCSEKTKALVPPKLPLKTLLDTQVSAGSTLPTKRDEVSRPDDITRQSDVTSHEDSSSASPAGLVAPPQIIRSSTPAMLAPPPPPPVSAPADIVTQDMQLWLNTLSRSPRLECTTPAPPDAAAVVKTVAQSSPSPQTNDTDREHKQAAGAGTPNKAESDTTLEEKPTCNVTPPPPAFETSKVHHKETPSPPIPGVNKAVEMQKTFASLSDRQSSLRDRLNVVSKRIFRYKSKELVRHIVAQLDSFDKHAITNQVEAKQQLPCQYKFEDRAPSHTRPVSHRTPVSSQTGGLMDGHAFSTSEKLHVSVGEELLHDTSGMLSRYDDEKTDSSSDEDEEIQSILGDKSIERSELSGVEQRWERERAQIAAQWTWIRGQYEDLQHRMRRESDLLSVYRDKKEKVVLLPNDHFMKEHIPDKFAHHPAMVPPPLNGYHNHPSLMMKNNFKFDMSRTGQEMYLKSNQHKRMNKTSKIDGNTCARTRPLACMVRRNVFTAKDTTRSIVKKNTPLRCSALGKHCNRKSRTYAADDLKQDSSYHPVLSRRTETHLNVHLTPLLSGVDFFPSADRKLHPPPEPRCETPKERVKGDNGIVSNVVSNCTPVSATEGVSSGPPVPSNTIAALSAQLSLLESTDGGISLHNKKRSTPGATVEHMIKKYRVSTSQPGSRATSPTYNRKKPSQFDINNIEVDFSVIAPARIERPRYKEIEIPKFRIISDELLQKLAEAEKGSEVEDDSTEAYLELHSRCERLEKVRFINMQINATGGMRGASTGMLSPAAVSEDSLCSNISLHSPNKSPPSDKRTIALVEHSADRKSVERHRVPSGQRPKGNAPNNKHVTYLEEEIRRTRASKHTNEYPTAVS